MRRTSNLEGGSVYGLYLDSADAIEIQSSDLITDYPTEIAGITTNPQLFTLVAETYLPRLKSLLVGDLTCDVERLEQSFARLLVAVGQDLEGLFDGACDISLPLHPNLLRRRDDAISTCREISTLVPSALIKIPFLPDDPGVLLLVRDLEANGIRVNVTCTFSTRQVAVVSLLGRASRTNVFVGRITRGLDEMGAGEWVATQAQQFLVRQRATSDCLTHLIAASVHDAAAMERVLGCDYVTASPATVASFLAMTPENAEPVSSKKQCKDKRTFDATREGARSTQLSALSNLDEGLISFLLTYRKSAEYKTLADPDRLYHRFADEGFSDIFYHPSYAERRSLGNSRLPDFSQPIAKRCALDSLFSLLAHADLSRYQAAVDRVISSLTTIVR